MCDIDIFVYMLQFFFCRDQYIYPSKPKTKSNPHKKKRGLSKNKSSPPNKSGACQTNQVEPTKNIIRSSFGPQACPIVNRLVQFTMTTQKMAVYASTSVSAATALEKNLQTIVPKIREIIELCGRKQAGMMQPSVDKIVQMCLDAGLAVKRNIMPRNTWNPPGEPW